MRAAVAGTGFGCRVHVPALRAAGFDVVALVGTDADRTARRAARAGVPIATTSLRSLCELSIDAVTIATPPLAHASLVASAARAGWHVVCEKPFALDAIEAYAMLGAVTAAGVQHVVGHEFRLAEDRATITRAINDGLIGEPRLITIAQAVPLVGDPEARMPGWWFDPASGGGWLGASGSHLIDCVRAWTGAEFASVSAALPRVSARESTAADDSFAIRATLTTGCEVVLTQTAAGWGSVVGTTWIAGTGGTLWIDGGRVMHADRSGSRALPTPADITLPAPATSDDPRHRFTHLELGPYTRLCEGFRARIEGAAPPEATTEPVPLATFADGVAEMKVLDAIRLSATQGGAYQGWP